MAYLLAVDVGTNNITCAVAEWGPDGLQKARLVRLGSCESAVPNVLYCADDGRILVGEEAEACGLKDPERLIRGYKHRVGDPVPMHVGGNRLSAEQMLAAATRWVVDQVEKQEGSDPESLIVSYPSTWGEYRTGLVRHALRGVGVDDVTLISEAVAAASYFASKQNVGTGSAIAVYNLGADFSAAVLEKSSAGTFSLLSHADSLDKPGSADFDDAVFRHVMHTANGEIQTRHSSGDVAFQALVQLRRHCVEAKEKLSTDPEATIRVPLPESELQVRLTRGEFEDSIGDQVNESINALLCAVDRAGIKCEDLEAIVLTGGSSRIPLIALRVSERTARPVFVDADSRAAVSLGAAAAAALAIVRQPVADEMALKDVARPVATHRATTDWARPRRGPKGRGLDLPGIRVPRLGSSGKIALAGSFALLSALTLTGAQGPRAEEPLASLTSLEAIQGKSTPRPPVGIGQLPPNSFAAAEAGLEAAASQEKAQPKLSPPEPLTFPGKTPSAFPTAEFPPAPGGGPTAESNNTAITPFRPASSDGAGVTVPSTEVPTGGDTPEPAATSGIDVAPVPDTDSETPASPEANNPEPSPDVPALAPEPLPDVLQTVPGLVE